MPTIKLGEWPLDCVLWDSEVLAGPVPMLFADTPYVAGDAMRADMGKTHYDLNRLHKVFFGTEEIQLREALSLVKKSR